MKKIMLTGLFALLMTSAAIAQTEPNSAPTQTPPTMEHHHLEHAKDKPACCKKDAKEKCAHHKDKAACDAKKDGKKDCKKKCKKKCKKGKMNHEMKKDSVKQSN